LWANFGRDNGELEMSQRVYVQHEPKYNHNGDVIGLAYRRSGHVVQDVHQEYLHKDVRGNKMVKSSSGDIWSVRRVNHPDYQFITV